MPADSRRKPVVGVFRASPEEAAVIRRRVSPLVRQDRAIIDLMGDAYIQGLSDAVNMPKEPGNAR